MKTLFSFVFVGLFLTGNAWAEDTLSKQEKNKQVVLEFYELGLNQKNADAAIKLLGNRYVQHNPNAADGAEGFKKFIAYLKQNTPDSRSEIKQVFADGDFVILHVKNTGRSARGSAIIDIFKLENEKIVEHWDVIQPIPEKSANNNGMF